MKNLVIKNEYERIVFGEVYSPLFVDSQMDAMTADEIKKSAYNFMREGRVNKIDLMHNFQETGSYVVESFIARKNDPDEFIEGSWVLGVKIESDEVWTKILKGEINGFSLAGSGDGKRVDEPLDLTSYTKGETFKSMDGLLPEHQHNFELSTDKFGRVIKTETTEALGHIHTISKTTATDMVMEHSHRFDILERNGN